MRLIHVADVHLGVTRFGVQTPTGNSRVADFGKTLDGLVEYVSEFKPDAVLFAGDTFNTRHPGPDALAIFAKVLTDITRLGAQVVVLPGNHDGMSTIGDPRTHALLWARSLDLPMVDVITQAGHAGIGTRGGNLNIFALPYPHKRSLDRILPGLTGAERTEAIGSRLEDAIATLAVRTDFPHVFLGHLSVAGSRLGSEQAMKMGWDVVIRPEVLERFDYAALGHIHRAQQVGERAFYAGSPDYIDFGEATQTKGFYMVDLVAGKAPNVTYLPSNTRPLVDTQMVQTSDGTFDTSGFVGRAAEGAIVRLRLLCSHEKPTPAAIAAAVRWMRDTMRPSYLKTEVVLDLPESRERAAIDSGTDVGEALRRWLAANGLPEEPALTVGRELAATVAG